MHDPAADLLARLDRQLIDDTAQRWAVVTGGPGMGKSAVLAAWLVRREAAGDIVPHHFIARSTIFDGDAVAAGLTSPPVSHGGSIASPPPR